MQSLDGGATWTTNGQDPACEPSGTLPPRAGPARRSVRRRPPVQPRHRHRALPQRRRRRDVDGRRLARGGTGRGAVRQPAAGSRHHRERRSSPAPTPASSARRTAAPRGRPSRLGPRAIGPVAASGSTVYVGTARRGIFASDDDGVTWRPASGGLPGVPLGAIDMLLTPGSDVVYAFSTTSSCAPATAARPGARPSPARTRASRRSPSIRSTARSTPTWGRTGATGGEHRRRSDLRDAGPGRAVPAPTDRLPRLP